MREFDVDCERRHPVMPIELHLDPIRIDRHVPAHHRKDFLAQDRGKVLPAVLVADWAG